VRFIPTRVHGVIDYLWSIALIASPWLFGFSGEVFWPHLLFGLFSVAASLVSRSDPRLHTLVEHGT
jgi:hypothetical protein